MTEIREMAPAVAGQAAAPVAPRLFPRSRPVALRDPRQQIVTLAIDAEEDFDWDRPVSGTDFTTDCMRGIRDVQEIFGAYGVVPTYLLTYPVLEDIAVVRMLRRQLERGECAVGIQLHPWVTPPFEGPSNAALSYPCNLPAEIENRKLEALSGKFGECFGTPPRIYRAGRYGLGGNMIRRLEELGFEIDVSIAPRTDFSSEGGPDFSDFPYQPFWFGHRRDLLELPLCRSIVGWGMAQAPRIYRAAATPPLNSFGLSGPLTWVRCAERITLSPEGNDAAAMIRLARRLREAGQRIMSISFHSSSLAVGRSPYVRDRAGLHLFYDRLSEVLDHFAGQPETRFMNLADIPHALRPPGP